MEPSPDSFPGKIRSRTPLFGGWTSLGHPSITEIFAHAGFDFLGIDMEHSTISQEQAQQIIAAAHAGGTACLPRPSSPQAESQMRRLLDSGADGVIVPDISTPAQVGKLIEWTKYPPLGKRSYGVSRAHGYGFDFDSYVSRWNKRSTLVIQIESISAVEAIDPLLSIPEVDGVMVGPYDLSGSLGIPGQLSHPRVLEACRQVIGACRRAQKGCGTQVVDPTPENVNEAFEMGYTFVVLASDVFTLWKWSERMQLLMRKFRHAPARPASLPARPVGTGEQNA